jgi:hypothetical protein
MVANVAEQAGGKLRFLKLAKVCLSLQAKAVGVD